MIKAVFFDFDGVITIEATGTISIVNYITSKTDIDKDLFEKEYRKHNPDLLLGKVTHKQIWNRLCESLNRKIPYKILTECFLNTELDSNIISLARRIKSIGYKVGIITDNKTDRIQVISELHKFTELFDVISVSASLGMIKTNREIFLKACRDVEVSPEEAVFIDNNPKNLTAPKEIGMHVIYFDHDERDYDNLINQLEIIGIKSR